MVRINSLMALVAIALVTVLGINPVMGQDGFTPPDTGHPNRTQGSGTR
jgi:hypothetical protein